MCLSAMMMGAGGGGGGNFFTNLPAGSKAKLFQSLLWLVLLAHLGLAIALIVLSGFTGVYELIAVMILFCANSQANFWCLVMYMLRCLIGLLQMFSLGGLIVQRKTVEEDMGVFVISWIFVAFYLIALTMAFYSYREFKALMMGQGGMMGGMSGPMGGGNHHNSSVQSDNNEDYHRIGKFRNLLNYFYGIC